ncbi:MAG: metal-dependent hydrolase, partial [Methanobrevibacter arboriphilus]|nr:metal-dependent hydrolase [Methanobrevibacter arboriphilus]
MIFFQNPISIVLVIIGASLPDFDHNIKKLNVYKMIIIGLISFIILYIANLPYLVGIIFLIIPIIFYFSNHRGFTHSIFGIFLLSLLLSIVIIMGIFLIYPSLEYLDIMNNIENYFLVSTVIIVLVLGILTINKNLIVPFIVLFLLG